MLNRVEHDDADRPIMFCATQVFNPGPTRIGTIGNHVTLPRTVPLVSLIAAAAGAFFSVVLMVVFTRSFSSLIAAAGIGGSIGWIVMSWSPLRGESFARWLGLTVTSFTDRRRINGQMVRVSVGVAPVNRLAGGRTTVIPGSFDVAPGTVDSHGRFIDGPGGRRHPDLASRQGHVDSP